MKNNAAAAHNYSDSYLATVYYNSYFKGPRDNIYLRSGGNLSKTYNQNASFEWS
ncbi:hypothetical protein [Streptomyces melanogenes]|uniref:hypothetical protein n=1 Tax=Streptomyces melanogenes TaxID=67326 RepID=UPI0037A87F7D